jgi:hypothetical protein
VKKSLNTSTRIADVLAEILTEPLQKTSQELCYHYVRQFRDSKTGVFQSVLEVNLILNRTLCRL